MSKRDELLPVVVEAYAAGRTSLRKLAVEHGVDPATIYRWLLTAVGDERYRELVTDCLVARIAEADGDLDGAMSVLEVQKAREKARFARMDFERRRPALYGQKQEVTHQVAPVLHIHTTAPQEKVVEGSRVPPALPAPGEK